MTERVMSLKPDKKGRREAEFWARPRSESARAEILVVKDRVGWTMLKADDWRNALRLAADQVYVDGSFTLRSEAEGWKLTGIRATFPPPSSG